MPPQLLQNHLVPWDTGSKKGEKKLPVYQLISSYRGHYYVAKVNHALLQVIRKSPKMTNMCIVWYCQNGYFHDLCPRGCIGTGRLTCKLAAKRYHDHGFYGVSHQIIESDAWGEATRSTGTTSWWPERKTESAASNDFIIKTWGKSTRMDPHW